ncbi:diguanylate cyclase [Aliiglaciecola sp. 3_MG-2023]|uniref:GGDEF domain-containing response regulator n=1 Tax=Aliiglaciecola sp. 3_MG-2023 TaxID=3062644 RepID=UPI0026E2C924|nr:diguanylate cyclase [Aliiglaciecola sp. 3_MG-2023]MDO6692342.1 diguanylate cyclase [Aliiglaciecola sp. 3_MG-2023]
MIGKHYIQQGTLQEALVLIVDDEPINAMVVADLLSNLYQTKVVHSGEEALAFCRQQTPDLILLDVMMPGISGLETCRAIKNNQSLQHIPVIFITSVKSQNDENKCWEAGGVDFVNKPVNGITLLNRVKAHLTLKMQSDFLRRMSFTDGLTGLYNRHLLEEVLTKSILQSKRTQSPLSLFMLDIDWFKLFNDSYGHLSGDQCLIAVSKVLKEVLHRPVDMSFRYGGEEFLCLLPDTDSLGAQHIAKTILQKVADLNIPHESSPYGIVSLSIGIYSSTVHNECFKANEVIRSADKALYLAKQKGRNQFVC